MRQGLVSLAVAARMVHRRAYPQQYAIAEPLLEIQFGDGREPIRYLAARVETTNLVACKLREITRENADDALIRTDKSPPTPTR